MICIIVEGTTEKDLIENKYFAIVDADTSFSSRNSEMLEVAKDKADFYIFPNHQDDGDLETLLLSQINKENNVIKCFDRYQECVAKDIDDKAKLYAYTTLVCNQKPEEYIKTLTISSDFDTLKQKLKNLFN